MMRWLLLLALLLASPDAFARARSSGGYGLPGGGSRTPSFSSPSYSARTPSFSGRSSGGYGLPSTSRRPSVDSGFGGSAGDQAFSRQQSGAGLNAFRAQQAPAPSYSAPSYSAPAPRYGGGYGYSAPVPYSERPGWFANRGYAPPSTTFGGRRQFGVWDGLFLGALLSNLTRPSSGEWFHNHQDDPGYQQWRAEADRQARDNADLRQRLAQLDQQLADRQNQPKDPSYMPPDVPPAVAQGTGAATGRTPSVTEGDGAGSGFGWVPVVLVLGGGALVVLWWMRSRHAAPAGGSMSAIGTAANIVRHKLSGEGYTPDKFRVGMTITADPAPFVLLGQATKVPTPEFGGAVTSVTSIGQIESGGARLLRLYLDRRSFVQLHLDPAGDPDECRYFAQIDEITPADADEWGVWLSTDQGLIGWPQFQTKDGKTYDRVWSPGAGRVSPRTLTETVEGPGGKRSLRSQAMLYGAPTGVPAPAPQTEYVMVAAVEEGRNAWVEVHAGLDLNPATLQLS